MEYTVRVYTLQEANVSIKGNVQLEAFHKYVNIEHGDTGDELLAVFSSLFNQQSRVKSISVIGNSDKLHIDVMVNRDWNALRFSKKLVKHKLKRLNDLIVLSDRIRTPVKRGSEVIHNYHSLISLLFTETNKPIH